MTRVAVFAKNFCGYSETFLHDEVRSHTRYEVDVFCRRRLHEDRFPHHPVHLEARRPYPRRRAARGFAALARERNYRLLHAHFGTGGVLAAPLARRAALPLVVSFHGYDVPLMRSRPRWGSGRWRYTRRAPAMLQQMALGLCASGELREILHEYGVPWERLRVHRLGIDLARFRPRGARGRGDLPQIAMVGRLVPKKGFRYGLRALAAAAEKFPLRAVIAGTGPLHGELHTLAVELGLAEHVSFRGNLDGEAVAALLRESDILLCPSVVASDGNRESGLLVAKEASACEVVPVGTVHGGLPEIVDDAVTGYLVPERSVDALADRLQRLLGDAALRERMGRAARRKIELEYDLRERNRALEALYDEVIEAWKGDARAGH